MHIVIDLTAILPIATGVDNYLKQLFHHLATSDTDNSYRIYVNCEDADELRSIATNTNFRILPRCIRSRFIRILFQQLWLPLANLFWADVIHSPSFIMPLFRGKQRHMLTVQDMTSFTVPQCHNNLRRSGLYRFLVAESIKRADLISVPSQTTKSTILRILPNVQEKNITIIPYAADEMYVPQANEVVKAFQIRRNIPDNYILFVGTIEPRKNLTRLLQSFSELAMDGKLAGHHLLIAGNFGWSNAELLSFYQQLPKDVQYLISFLGYVERADLPLLYSGATLFIYPSLEEGFGLPPLEAMSCGTPTITSNRSSLAEHFQDGALLIEPEDTEEIKSGICNLLNNEQMRQEYRTKGLRLSGRFSWRRMAEETLACYSLLSQDKL